MWDTWAESETRHLAQPPLDSAQWNLDRGPEIKVAHMLYLSWQCVDILWDESNTNEDSFFVKFIVNASTPNVLLDKQIRF